MMNHLDRLESQTIFIVRDVYSKEEICSEHFPENPTVSDVVGIIERNVL